ncbi:S8 family serine peptidase [Natrinema salaciae]|uniref:S8 family serine peptidase n=1 Tax=Natrinema salaciae TaxID=1186196 RepID=UPI001587AB39|nr:S8/S53 family peptidase [Natrinema salaciae]
MNASVAIIDSVYNLPEEFEEHIDSDRTEDFVGRPGLDDTTGHGTTVSNILYAFSRNVEFNFYRAVRETGTVLQRDLLKAIGRAHQTHDTDIINLSLGYDHSHDGVSCDMPNEPCKVREAAKRAIDDGITVVAAAGNADESDEAENDEGVCCPALLNEVISVGGMFPVCTATAEEEHTSTTVGPNTRMLPPFAGWIHTGDPSEVISPLCTGLGCSPTENCGGNLAITEWGGNVDHEPSEIDVLAPGTFPLRNLDGEPDITEGTSFAVPVVTAVVAEITAFLKAHDEAVLPTQIQAALANTAEEVQHGDGLYLQGASALKRISSRKDLRGNFTRRPDDLGFDHT